MGVGLGLAFTLFIQFFSCALVKLIICQLAVPSDSQPTDSFQIVNHKPRVSRSIRRQRGGDALVSAVLSQFQQRQMTSFRGIEILKFRA